MSAMGFIRQNRGFWVLICICLVLSVAGSFFAIKESGQVKLVKAASTRAMVQFEMLLADDPSPSADNVAASVRNVVALKLELDAIRKNLQRGSHLVTSDDGVAVMAGIQQYISKCQRRVLADLNQESGPTRINMPDNFAFGFEQYIATGAPLRDPKMISVLDKQRQVLTYIINLLIDSNPVEIRAVEREVFELEVNENDSVGRFIVSDAVSARVPDAIETMAFRVTFTGNTNVLRHFLNQLSEFELPVVVRSIEVECGQGGTIKTFSQKGDELDAIFRAMDSASQEGFTIGGIQYPVIDVSIYTYSMVLEFFEIIISEDSGLDASSL